MRRIATVLAMLCIGITVSLAHPTSNHPAYAELTGGASYFKPEDGHSSWALAGELAFPISESGYVLIGPAVQIVDADEDFQAFGGVIEFNLTGGSGLFFGGTALYDPDAPEGSDDHTVDVRGGFKAAVGGGGLIKLFLQHTVDGYGESKDLAGAAMFGVRF